MSSVLERLYTTGKRVFIVWTSDEFPIDSPYAAELHDRAVAFNEALEAARSELGLCDPDRDLHFHGSGDYCECGARPNTAWAGAAPFSEGESRPGPKPPATQDGEENEALEHVALTQAAEDGEAVSPAIGKVI